MLSLAIEAREGIPVSQQRLISGGRQLRQGQQLEETLGVARTVEVLLRIQGGAKKDKGKKGKDKKGKGNTGEQAADAAPPAAAAAEAAPAEQVS